MTRWNPWIAMGLVCCLAATDSMDGDSFVRKRRLLRFGDIRGLVSDYASWFGKGHRFSAESLGLTMLYYSLAHVLVPENILIIGTGEGTVPMIFAEAMRDLQEMDKNTSYNFSITVVDAYGGLKEGRRNEYSYNLMTSEYPEIRIFENFSHQIPSLVDAGLIPRPNLVMIDGDHSAVVALHDFIMVEPLLLEPSAVLLHDTLYPTSKMHLATLGSPLVVEYIRKQRASDWALIDLWFVGSGLAIAMPLTYCEETFYDEYLDITTCDWMAGACPKESIQRGSRDIKKKDFHIFHTKNDPLYSDEIEIIGNMEFSGKVEPALPPARHFERDMDSVTVTADRNPQDRALGMTSTSCIPGVLGDNCSDFLYRDLRDKWLNYSPYVESEPFRQRQVIAAASLRSFNAKSVFEVGGYPEPLINFVTHDLDLYTVVDPLLRPQWQSNIEGTARCPKCTIKEVRQLPCLLQDILSQKFDIGAPFEFDAVVVLGYDDELEGMQGEDILDLLELSSASSLVLEVAVEWTLSHDAIEALISTLVQRGWQIRLDIVLDLKWQHDLLQSESSHMFTTRRLVTLQKST
jgi:hypothetical protein